MESARCRAFVTSAEKGSFTAAGKVLDYTPSGVSQLVRALEDELGLTLLSRQNKGVVLTREGENLYPQVIEYLKREENMFNAAKKVTDLSAGSITIATFTSIATHILPGIIKGFSSLYGNLGIKIVEGSKFRIEELLYDNKADLAFSSRIDIPGYTWMPFMKDRIVAVLSKDHRLAGAGRYPIEECRNDNLIMSDSGCDMDVIEMLKTNGISPDVRFSTIENWSKNMMNLNTIGVNIVNEFITRSWESDCVLLPLDPPASVDYGIVLPSAEGTSPAVRRFVSFASEMLM